MWFELGMKAVQGYLGGAANRATARANNRLSAVNAEVGNKVRVESNAAVAAKGNLNRWVQSVSNNRVLDQGGDALEAATVNYRRSSDAGIRQSFSASIRDAEQQGVMAAQSAFSGVDGGVVDMVNSSVALRDSIVQQGIEDSGNFADYDASRRAGNIMSQMVGGLDNSILLDTLDTRVDYAQESAANSPLTDVFNSVAPLALQYLSSSMGSKAPAAAATKTESLFSKGGLSTLFGTRERSSSSFDLADQAYDTGVKFGFKAADKSSYELGSKLGSNSNDSSIYGLWSR